MTQQIGSELPEIEPRTGLERDATRSESESVLPGESIYSERHVTQALERGLAASHTPFQDQRAAQHAVASASRQASVVNADDAPQIADDTDLIEKEWVLKAKEIVERTKHDPFQQNKGVERLKANYMQKRYNKEIKLTED